MGQTVQIPAEGHWFGSAGPWSDRAAAIGAVMQAMQAHSPHVWQHGLRVGRYTAAIALALRLKAERVALMERCGLLHDIGKLCISPQVLANPEVRGAGERTLLRTHPELGVRLLRPHQWLSDVLYAVAMHHERVDGAGYPYGLRGDAIPLEARIVAVANAYDSMTADRAPSRKDDAVARLRQAAGRQLDARLVQVFADRVVPAFA